jgi:hypothetical protein
VCLSLGVSRFLSFLFQHHGGADFDDASWNTPNTCSCSSEATLAPMRSLRSQAVGVASI